MQDIQILTWLNAAQGTEAYIQGDLNDISVDSTGNVQWVQGTDLIRQQIIKSLLTLKGQNLLLLNYGTMLESYIGSRLTLDTQSAIGQEVTYALSYLAQLIYPNSQSQYTQLTEQINSLQNITVIQSPSDPRLFVIQLQILLNSGDVVTFGVGG
jgi:hypothetical protein